MPGNEFGDRVHNFFAQESSLQGEHQSHQVAEGNWTASNDNFWVVNQRQSDVLNLNGKNHSTQNLDIDRGQSGFPFHLTQTLNFTQSNQRAEFGRSQPQNGQPNFNGYIYGSQFHPSRQNEANFLASDSDPKQHHLITSGGLSGHVVQQGIDTEHQKKTSETSVLSGGFDLFGGQQQINQQPNIQHQNHHPGFNEVQHQHQLMMRKMQDLQRQQQFQQVDLRQQNLIKQIPTFPKQASGSHSSNMINGNTVSGSLQYPWTTDIGTNWLNNDSSTLQGSPNGLFFPPNLGQTQNLADMIPQQVDQSLYGVPVSSSRGLALNQYSDKVTDRLSMLKTGDNLRGNHIFLPDQVGVQDRTPMSSQRLENMFGDASNQSLDTESLNIGGFKRVGSFQRNAPQDFLRSQELATGSDIPNAKSTGQVTANNETSLDPTEEKILFGSDDNIWAAFGTGNGMIGESGSMFDNTDLNGFPSIQSGSWSALMQSAIAETSSCDVEPQEEWSGLMTKNADGSSVNQSSTRINNVIRQSLVDNDIQLHSALTPASLPLANDANTNDVGLNLLGRKFLTEPDQRIPNETSHRFISLEESNKWTNYSTLQKSVAEGIQNYGGTSQVSQEAEKNTVKISSPWVHEHSIAQQRSDGRSSLAAPAPSCSNRFINAHKDERLPQNIQNNQMNVIQGANEVNKVTLTLNDNSPFAISRSVGGGDEVGPFAQNNPILSQWKNNNSGISRGGETLCKVRPLAIERHQGLDTMNACDKNETKSREIENSDTKETSNDSHRSNLSWNTSGGYKEAGLSNSNDSRSLPLGKQNSGNYLSRKVSGRAFQYHPMGNLDEDAEPPYGINQSNHMQAMSQQNPHFDQSNFSVHFPLNTKEQSSDLQKLSNEGPVHGVANHALNKFAPFSRHFDSYTQDKASSSGQNMLELLPKVDQSSDHGIMMPLSSECDVPTQFPEAEKYDGSSNNYQQNKSPVNQVFGLQLGPPSQQRTQTPGSVSLIPSNNIAPELGEKLQQIVPTSVDQSSSLLNFDFQSDSNNKGSAFSLPHHSGNGKMHGDVLSTSSSGPLHKSVLNGKMMNPHIESSFNSMQRGSADTVPLDAHCHVEKSSLVKSHDASQQTPPTDVHERDATPVLSGRDSLHASQHIDVYNVSHQGSSINLLQNTKTNFPGHQRNYGVQYQDAVSRPSSELNQPNIVESSSFPMPDNDRNACKGTKASSIHSPGGDVKELGFNESSGLLSSSVIQDPVSKIEDTLAKASKQNSSNNSPVMMSMTNNEIESFGQSLKPNARFHQNLGFSNNADHFKDAETDPSFMVSKRMKGPDHVSNTDLVSSMRGQKAKDPVSSSGNVHSQEIVGQDVNVPYIDTSTDHTSSSRVDYSDVSPQMAPSWFNKYGTIKNSLMLHQYDKVPIRPEELPFTTGKSLDATDSVSSEEKGTDTTNINASQFGTSQASIPTHVPYENSQSRSSQLNTTNQEPVISSTKKRKSDYPLHSDMLGYSQNLRALSLAEAEWNKVTDSHTEKIDYDAEFIEDGTLLLKSKRRLILTTQLMQLLFLPPPADILSSDASCNSESIAYAVSRTLLRDVCSMVSSLSGLSLPPDGVKFSPDHPSGRKGERFYAKVIEDLMGRSLDMENELSRLDKNSSIFDLRMECQDLDKFSVINRLAKFHGRGHSDIGETAASFKKPLPQRYVTALPLPRNLPDRVQCLSL